MDIYNYHKYIIEESPMIYSYHRIICNKDGIPSDFEFIDVNRSFEKFIGLKSSDIIGNIFTKVLPLVEKNKFDLIYYYGYKGITNEIGQLIKSTEFLKFGYELYIYSQKILFYNNFY